MNGSCSNDLLAGAVALALSPDEESALSAHLETCEECCARLDELAGGESWRQETATLLRQDALDDITPEPRAWSEIDFSVEHLEPSEDASVLGRLGGYDIVGIVGRGGMGVVLKAFDRDLKRFVAMKVLAPHLAHSSVARKRFAREAQAAAAVVDPHAIAIHHVQPAGRLPFLVMPLLAGESLAQRLKAQAPLALAEVLRIGMQAAAGLAAAHDQGLVHRDVKPANIFLEKGVERVVITDFGLARAADDVSLTRLGVVAGTPEYMSPEQARGEALDGRSDLFSLGCVLYEMATGLSPFRAESTIATLRRIVEESPPAIASLGPELPPWFAMIVERLLAKNPADRYSSAREVSELLEGCLAHLQQPKSAPLPASLTSSPRPKTLGARTTRKPLRLAAVAVLAAIGAAALAILFWQSTEPPDIAGAWMGDEWGQVELEAAQLGAYDGTYSDTYGQEKGQLQLEWSRIERRFNGTWHEGKERFGKISLRLVDDEIRGAWTTSKKAELNPATPKLADLLWRRSESHPLAGANERIPSNHAKPASRRADPPAIPAKEKPTLVRKFETDAPVSAFAISADEKLLAVAFATKPVVEVLDSVSGKSTVTLEITTDEEKAILASTKVNRNYYSADSNDKVSLESHVAALAFSPDGNQVAVGTSVGQVKLFSTISGELLRVFDDEEAKLAEAAKSEMLAKTPETMTSLRRAMGRVSHLAFSPDGTMLAMSGDTFGDMAKLWTRMNEGNPNFFSGRGRLKTWDVATGKLQHDFPAYSLAGSIAWSPDGNSLVCGGQWRGRWEAGCGAIVWNPHTGEKVRVISLEYRLTSASISFALSPDGRYIAVVRVFTEGNAYSTPKTTATTEIFVLEAESGKQVWNHTLMGGGHLAGFLHAGNTLVVLRENESLCLIEAASGNRGEEFQLADFGVRSFYPFALSSGSEIFLSGWSPSGAPTVEVWNIEREGDEASGDLPQNSRIEDPSNSDESKALQEFEGDWKIEPDESRSPESRYEGTFCFRRGTAIHLGKGKILFNGKMTIDPTKDPATFLMEREAGEFSRGVCYLHGEYEFRPNGDLWLQFPDTSVRPGEAITQPNRLLKLRRPGDDRMQGEWRLDSVTGRGLRAMEPGLQIVVRGNAWTIDREREPITAKLTVNPYIQPSTIDMTFQDENAGANVSRGLYRIEGDVLELFWSPKPSVRPASYDDPEASVHKYHRTKRAAPSNPSDNE